MFSDIDVKIMQHGHDKEYRIMVPSKKIVLGAKEFLKCKFQVKMYKTNDLEKAQKESENFMKRNFKLHKIYQSTESDFAAFVRENRSLDKTEFIEAYNKYGSLIEPYLLPLNLVDEYFWFGYIYELGVNHAVEEFFTKTNLIFSRILISNIITNFTPSIITHEITHSQLDSVRGSIKSFYNTEVLPIFINMLHHLENDKSNLEVEKIIRFEEISREIIALMRYELDEERLKLSMAFNHTMHIESVLKAFYLLDVYVNSNKSIQFDIKDFIQNIFDGKNTLEELLEIYNINLEDSTEFFIKSVSKIKTI